MAAASLMAPQSVPASAKLDGAARIVRLDYAHRWVAARMAHASLDGASASMATTGRVVRWRSASRAAQVTAYVLPTLVSATRAGVAITAPSACASATVARTKYATMAHAHVWSGGRALRSVAPSSLAELIVVEPMAIAPMGRARAMWAGAVLSVRCAYARLELSISTEIRRCGPRTIGCGLSTRCGMASCALAMASASTANACAPRATAASTVHD